MKRLIIVIAAAFLLFPVSGNAQSSSDFGTWTSIQLVKAFGAHSALGRQDQT